MRGQAMTDLKRTLAAENHGHIINRMKLDGSIDGLSMLT